MKKYKATFDFSSPTLGNVKRGDIVTVPEKIGDAMVGHGMLEDAAKEIEVKPAVEVAKESKPFIAKKKTK